MAKLIQPTQARPVYLRAMTKAEREELVESYEAFKRQPVQEDAQIVKVSTPKSGISIGCIGTLVLALSIPAAGLGLHSCYAGKLENRAKAYAIEHGTILTLPADSAEVTSGELLASSYRVTYRTTSGDVVTKEYALPKEYSQVRLVAPARVEGGGEQ